MTCERYWRDGIVLVERGQSDPHRDGCIDCARAHAARQELIECLPLIGEGRTGDPHWQTKVWQRIERAERPHAPRRWQWHLQGALVVACAVALWIGLVRRPGEERSPIEIVSGAVARRSTGAHVGDRLRVTVGKGSGVWIYRDEQLVLQCHPGQVSDDCAQTPTDMVVEIYLSIAGEYQVMVVEETARPSRGTLDKDRAALDFAGVRSRLYQRSVH